MPTRDILIAGLGPAGLALAAACSRRGLSVRAVDPRPGRVWSATYGMWDDQWEAACAAFPELSEVPVATTSHPRLVAPRRSGARPEFGRIAADYVVVDSPALQRSLAAACPPGMTSEQAPSTADLGALAAQGTRVVDCRGAVPPDLRADPAAATCQSAYGVVLPAVLAREYLPGGNGCLMDWRTDSFGSPAVPSFLYSVNLPGDRVLLEETDLVGAPALSITELRERLHRRLGWASSTRGGAGDLDDVERSRGVFATEKVRFPVLPAARPKGVETFGTAGTAGHPATGYSVGEILRSAAGAADALAAGRPIPSSPGVGTRALHRMGLRALRALDGPALQEMFAGFAAMDVRRQQAFLDRSSRALPTGMAMATQWWNTTNATRASVARAALLGR